MRFDQTTQILPSLACVTEGMPSKRSFVVSGYISGDHEIAELNSTLATIVVMSSSSTSEKDVALRHIDSISL